MFNSDNLVFNTSEYLKVARGIPYAYWLGVFGFLALAYITRSFAVWKLGRLYGIKNGLFLRSFLPFTRVSAYYLISKSTMGYTPLIRLLSALGNALYYVFVLGFFFAPTFNVMVVSLIILCIIYYLRALDLIYLSLGVTGVN